MAWVMSAFVVLTERGFYWCRGMVGHGVIVGLGTGYVEHLI
jgi:hypothetical protein